jgi:hypothetical protein
MGICTVSLRYRTLKTFIWMYDIDINVRMSQSYLKKQWEAGFRGRVVKVVDFQPLPLTAVGLNTDMDVGFFNVRNLSN